MTAEVAVINKSAVALASDSAVTVELIDSNGRNNDKIYNTANKLFSLSKYAPVGVMLYNTMELGGVPWETIIKEYRRHLQDGRMDRLEDYATDFWKFLEGNQVLFNNKQIIDVLLKIVVRYFQSLQAAIKSREDAKSVFDQKLNGLEKMEFAETFSEEDTALNAELVGMIDEAANIVFTPQLVAGLETEYRRLAILAITKSEQLSGYTGIVFAGFGEHDVFPQLIEFRTDLVYFNKVRKMQIGKYSPDQFNAGKVLSFAQQDITQTILTGINPNYANFVRNAAIEFFAALPETIIEGIEELTHEQKEAYKQKAIPALVAALKDFFTRMEDERVEKHTFPIEKAIQMMPFSELAEIAELFIKLTQVRRRLSPDSETVGGPIDVVIISKADGFIWVKRKFYFDKELNYSFMQNYLN